MSASPIQIGLTVLFLLALVRIYAFVHANPAAWFRPFLWLALWTLGLIAVWFPELTTRFAHMVGVRRGVDAVLYIAIALLSYVVLRLYAALERQDQVITRVVSELALRDGSNMPINSKR